MDKLRKLEEKLNYNFKDKELLRKAITHSSYSSSSSNNNERLEFLGDSILNFILTEYLYRKYPSFDEGTLSQIKAYVSSEKFLYNIAKSLNLGTYILMGKGEDKSGGRSKKSILADALEAIFAAIFIDSGIKKIKKVLLHLIKKEIDKLIEKNKMLKDYKSRLQEHLAKKNKSLPIYKIEREIGPQHNKTFEISVWINNKKLGFGTGRSKKEAAQLAAKKALIFLHKEEIKENMESKKS